ncbi:MAG: lysoplasmalogenase [Pirellulales bacterium]|nr:lysoplasmalogenase [Pirellulales bacterium]
MAIPSQLALEKSPGASSVPAGNMPRVVARALWVVWAVLLLGGFCYGLATVDDADARQHIPTVGRMGSSLVLVIAGIVGAWGAIGTPALRYAVLVALGMAAGFLGDLFNANLIHFAFRDNPTMGGIVSFAIGHIFYIAAGVYLARRAGFNDRFKWLVAVLGWQLIGLAGWFGVVFLAGNVGTLHWAALPYSLLLAGTAGMAKAIGWHSSKFAPLALGGALFLMSDLILAFELFRGSFPWGGDAVWLTYGPGQMLIVYSQWPALRKLVGG